MKLLLFLFPIVNFSCGAADRALFPGHEPAGESVALRGSEGAGRPVPPSGEETMQGKTPKFLREGVSPGAHFCVLVTTLSRRTLPGHRGKAGNPLQSRTLSPRASLPRASALSGGRHGSARRQGSNRWPGSESVPSF